MASGTLSIWWSHVRPWTEAPTLRRAISLTTLAFVLLLVPALAATGVAAVAPGDVRTVAASGVAPAPAGRGSASLTADGRMVALRGIVRLWHGDASSGPSQEGVLLDTGERVFDLDLPPTQAARYAGATVRVTGLVRANLVTPVRPLEVLADAGGTSSAMTAASAAAATAKDVVVILVNFSNKATQPWTPAAVEDLVLDANRDNPMSVRAFYEESSEDAATLRGAVLGWYTIAANESDGCGMWTWGSQAIAAATADALAAGYDLASPSVTKVYAFPSTASCPWSGAGELPGDETWINGAMTLRTVAHELGHNWGVNHAGALSCTSATGERVLVTARQDDDCLPTEYGDQFTIMGASATRTHPAWHRAQLGFPMGTTIVTPTATMDQTYTLTALEPGTGAGAVRLLRIARPTSPASYLDLELRASRAPFDAFPLTDPVVVGVSARIGWADSNRARSWLLDATLATAGFSDAPIPAGGDGIWDPVSGVRVVVVSVAGGVATVRIQGQPDTAAPTRVANLAATMDATPRVTLAWGAATDDRLLAGYEIHRNGVRCATVKALTFADTGAWSGCSGLVAGQTYTYAVAAYDAAGRVASATSATVTLPGPQAPATVTLAVGTRVITISWTAGAGAQSYEVVREVYDPRRARWGVQQTLRTTSTTLTDSVTKSGTYRYRVRSVTSAATSPYTTSQSVTLSR